MTDATTIPPRLSLRPNYAALRLCPPDEPLRVPRVAQLLGCSPSSVYHHLRRGDEWALPASTLTARVLLDWLGRVDWREREIELDRRLRGEQG